MGSVGSFYHLSPRQPFSLPEPQLPSSVMKGRSPSLGLGGLGSSLVCLISWAQVWASPALLWASVFPLAPWGLAMPCKLPFGFSIVKTDRGCWGFLAGWDA